MCQKVKPKETITKSANHEHMMRSFILRRRNGLVLAMFLVTLGSLVLANLSYGERHHALVAAAPPVAGLSSYLNSARQLLSSSLDANNQANTYAALMPDEDPRTTRMMRDTVDRTSHLISNYQQEGLANLPPLQNVPGLSTIMRLPDKLLRAELSMLQDGIRMAEEMRERPITATMNTPRDLANMFLRMLNQLNQ